MKCTSKPLSVSNGSARAAIFSILARGICLINCVWYLRAVCTLGGNESKSSDRFSISERVRAPASASLRARIDLKDVTNARLSLHKDVHLHERTQYLRQFEIAELLRVKIASLRRCCLVEPVELLEPLWENTNRVPTFSPCSLDRNSSTLLFMPGPTPGI